MEKKIKLWQSAVLTKDDDGNTSLVANAKEVLTTLHKKGINITICLQDIAKVDAEKCLDGNKVPYDTIKEAPAASEEEYDCIVVAGNDIVKLNSSWKWTIDDVAQKLYGSKSKHAEPTEQQQMDSSFDEYVKFAKNAAKNKDKICM